MTLSSSAALLVAGARRRKRKVYSDLAKNMEGEMETLGHVGTGARRDLRSGLTESPEGAVSGSKKLFCKPPLGYEKGSKVFEAAVLGFLGGHLLASIQCLCSVLPFTKEFLRTVVGALQLRPARPKRTYLIPYNGLLLRGSATDHQPASSQRQTASGRHGAGVRDS